VAGFPSMGTVYGGRSSTARVAASDGGGPEGGGATERGRRGGLEARKLWHSGADAPCKPLLIPRLGSLRWARSVAAGTPLLEWRPTMGEDWREEERPSEDAEEAWRRGSCATRAPRRRGGRRSVRAWQLALWWISWLAFGELTYIHRFCSDLLGLWAAEIYYMLG
jgi:hypothetical protein